MEGRIEVARKMKSKGLSPFEIAELTGLSENEINKL
jgi:predicted transcriptional regulator